MQRSPPPSIEERLCAAAYRILSDGQRHTMHAELWALRYLELSTPGQDLTSFIRAALGRVITDRPIPGPSRTRARTTSAKRIH